MSANVAMPLARENPFRSVRAGFAAVTLLLTLGIRADRFSAAAQNFPRAADIIAPRTYVSLAPVPRGREFEIAVVARITKGFHVNAHAPSLEYLIPTKVAAELPSGIAQISDSYPAGVMRGFKFSSEKLRVYEGSFTVKMKLKAADDAPLGALKLPLTISYQACNEEACLPPAKVTTSAELEIASASTPARAIHTDIFAAASQPAAPSHR